nr:MAG TPA: hypothetical protein [Caudoviricetes sp.]
MRSKAAPLCRLSPKTGEAGLKVWEKIRRLQTEGALLNR